MEDDIRWVQRFANYQKALAKLRESVKFFKLEYGTLKRKAESGALVDEMLKEGLIQRFEYTHELAWNVMKDYTIYQGIQDVGGSRDAVREAFRLNLIENGKVWMDMINSRNKTSYTYNEEVAEEIYFKIVDNYFPLLQDFEDKMKQKLSDL